MLMSEVQVGMKLRSTIAGGPPGIVTVTEITPLGFTYSLEAPHSMIPRWGWTLAKDGHQHFGMDGNAYFEIAQ